MIYAGFALIYDRLMQDIPYESWVNNLGRIFDKHVIDPEHILDIGCGTGNVTIALAEIGYRITGLDISSEMLSVAEQKSRAKGLTIEWLQQDMRQMELGEPKFDLVISMTDSMNYMSGDRELGDVFQRIKKCLKPGGWLIFDLNSHYKISTVFGNNIFTLLEDDIAYIWENSYDSVTHTCTMDLTFFVKEVDGKFRRFSEQHQETGYSIEKVTKLLDKAGFAVAGVYAENSFDVPVVKTERIYFVACSKREQ
ncbi:class I SAM-dependent DNA methyltransferase [Phosphitispora sp. TUW77]|uniref:class I SAM-dependent DNA methyltransferase n=1 Tax=Phosphitispora sp. TUW77 TaxID=3152361 RepID=UPI003AB30FFD